MIPSSRRFVLVRCVTTVVVLSHALQTRGEKVWEATFDTSADGVVDIADNNFGKVMIGPVTNGRLQIEAWDNSTDQYTPDKVGRVLMLNESTRLPVPRDYNDSQSAQYKFHWTALPDATEDREAYQLVGFLGNTTVPQTRQVMGAILRHWKVGADYYVSLDHAVMGVGYTDFGYKPGPELNLGPNPLGNEYELRIEFNGDDHVMSLKLLDSASMLLAGITRDTDTDLPGWHAYGQTNFNNETNSISVTHLGWEDYTGWGGDKAMIWQVDSLAYYDEPTVPGLVGAPDADYNNNGIVDAADFVIWRNSFGSTGTPGTLAGDGTSDDLAGTPDGDVDQFDYNFWRANFGSSVISAAGLASAGSAVPEPTSALLAALALTLLNQSFVRSRRIRPQ
jgi:hypothetical protein